MKQHISAEVEQIYLSVFSCGTAIKQSSPIIRLPKPFTRA
jgi:hypothetical protein